MRITRQHISRAEAVFSHNGDNGRGCVFVTFRADEGDGEPGGEVSIAFRLDGVVPVKHNSQYTKIPMAMSAAIFPHFVRGEQTGELHNKLEPEKPKCEASAGG